MLAAVTTSRRVPSADNTRAVTGNRPFGSTTTRAGLGPSTRRTVNSGSSGLAVDVMGVPARSGNAGIDRLPTLRDDNEIIDHALTQRAENIFPWLRQGTIGIAKRFRYRRPRQSGAGVILSAASYVSIRHGTASVHHEIPSFAACCLVA